ncbi:rRNA maturation RNase YbeY [Alkalicoccobacillus murimartini]|uniref:Endoribonuclease YbeY n=1 Tax=Alkalicoccobacillus murimartini TaxID=171685 RepID=A0ABT9YEB4_9BACI|nr:rRNA maturation RNase YbeY [Alkalicoccobacillus murimartini]MDQ0205542.1 putative rRNA maturation factor [Alkalicoccobacillus murimartini]
MAILVEVIDENDTITEKQQELLQAVIAHATELESLKGDYEVSISFVDDEEIRLLNNEHRGIDRGTDVLSFALNEGEEPLQEIEGMPNLLGDIVISIPRIQQQADEFGHSFERELGFLTVHGFLHLLGYDHLNEQDEKIMFGRQEEILTSYGLVR